MVTKNHKNFNYFCTKKEYSSFLFIELTLKTFLNSFFSKSKQSVINITLKKKSNYLLIYVFINKIKEKKKKQLETKVIDINSHSSIKDNINNYFKILKLPIKTKLFISQINIYSIKKKYLYSLIFQIFKKKKKLPNLLYLFNIIIYCQNIQLLGSLLEQNLKKTKKHKWYLKSINLIFKILFKKYNNFLGYKIQLKGRINGKPRSKKISIQNGKIPLNSININLKYYFQKIESPYGTFGLKIWLCFPNCNKQ